MAKWSLLFALPLWMGLASCAGPIGDTARPWRSAWDWAERDPSLSPPDSVSLEITNETTVFSHRAEVGSLELLAPMRLALHRELDLAGVTWTEGSDTGLVATIRVVSWTPASQATMSNQVVLKTHITLSRDGKLLFEGEAEGPPAVLGRQIGQTIARGGVPS